MLLLARAVRSRGVAPIMCYDRALNRAVRLQRVPLNHHREHILRREQTTEVWVMSDPRHEYILVEVHLQADYTRVAAYGDHGSWPRSAKLGPQTTCKVEPRPPPVCHTWFLV